MNSTFKYWFIANFEIVLLFLVLFISGILVLFNLPSLKGSGIFGELIFIIATLSFTLQTKNLTTSIVKYVLLIALCVYTSVSTEPTTNFLKPYIVWIWISFGISSVIGVWLAYVANQNFDEVVSRRMLWRNSNVDLFEIKWEYTLDRFFNISFSLIACISCLVVVISLFN